MINFHRPELWQRDFSLRASAALPPCGDLCLVWRGSEESLLALLHGADAHVEEGPVEREGGRRAVGSSIYVRDPDGNLVEFLAYPEESTIRAATTDMVSGRVGRARVPARLVPTASIPGGPVTRRAGTVGRTGRS